MENLSSETINPSVKPTKSKLQIKRISRDAPLAELILRRYERPYNLGQRDLLRKLCLSLGLLQPGDSRDVVVDVLYALLLSGKAMSSEEVQESVIAIRKQHNIPVYGVAASNIRRQLMRLRQLFLIEKIKNTYRVTELSHLHTVFEERIERYYLPSLLERVKEYLKAVDDSFGKKENVEQNGEKA